MKITPSIPDLLENHITLDIECADRVYLNGYIPTLQTSGGLVNFLRQLGFDIPSPAILKKIGDDFVSAIKHLAHVNNIPIIHFEKGQRKDDIANKYRKKFEKQHGIVFIGVAQERAYAFRGKKYKEDNGYIGFEYSRGSVYVNHYYFYVQDEEFGPGFIKICSYAPFGIKICLNGHEWAKQQLRKHRINFEALDNGFLSCESPKKAQKICNSLNQLDFGRFLSRWLKRIPFPINSKDYPEYSYGLSIHQLEISRTQVFTRPLRGREFFEAVIRENLDLGRPDRVQLIFEKRVRKDTPSRFRTRVITNGVNPSLHIEYKRCHVKQYFKEGRALRTETTINNPHDFYVNKGISNFAHLRAIGLNVNRRLLDVQHVSEHCILSEASYERVVQSTINRDGQRAPGLHFGNRRVMALFGALTSFTHLPNGLTNQSLRELVADYLGPEGEYTSRKMTYDLRRLRLNGIIYRKEHTNRYFLTPYGLKVTFFFTKLGQRIFRLGFAGIDNASFPSPLGRLFNRLTNEISNLVNRSKIGA